MSENGPSKTSACYSSSGERGGVDSWEGPHREWGNWRLNVSSAAAHKLE